MPRTVLPLRRVHSEAYTEDEVGSVEFLRQGWKFPNTCDGPPRCAINLDLVSALGQLHRAYLAFWANGKADYRLGLRFVSRRSFH